MNLSPKATRFVIEALEHYLSHHDRLLELNELSEDDKSDLMNDREYLESIKHDMGKYHEELVYSGETAQVE